jgi:hypothetical protein
MTPKYGLLPGSLVTSMLDLIDRAGAEPVPLALTKRAEFFLEEMMAAGANGITTIDYPGVRVGDAVHKLRKAGVNIETKFEQHGGEFAGSHGRYILKSKVIRLFDSPPTSQLALAGQANHA